MNRRHRSALMATCALALALTGCTATAEDAPSDPQDLSDVSIDDYGSVTAKLDLEHGTVSLPLDAYDSRSPEIENLLDRARFEVFNQCLSTHGLAKSSGEPPSATAVAPNNRRYFLWDLPTAEKFGFGIDPAGKAGYPDPKGDPAVIEACRSEGLTAIMPYTGESLDGNEESGPGIDYRLRQAAETLVEKDTGFSAAIADIENCFSDHGLKSDGHGHIGDGYADAALDKQIPVAVTVVKCATDTGAAQKVYDLQARYESALMSRYEAQLAAQKDKTATTVTTLKKIIEDAEAGTYVPATP